MREDLTMPACDAPGIPDCLLDLTPEAVKDICDSHRAGTPAALIAIAQGAEIDTVETVIRYVFDDEVA